MTKHAAPDAAAHTLPSLVSALGPATLDEALALVEGASKAALVKEGAAVATPRIGTDAARMYGEACDFLGHATKAQLEQMPVMSRDWLRIAVAAAAEGDRRYAALYSHAADEATKQAISGADAAASLASAEAKRGQLLRSACTARRRAARTSAGEPSSSLRRSA